MIQSILWTIFLALVPTLLGVTKDFFTILIKTVQEAELIVDQDGKKLPGWEKREYVLEKLTVEIIKLNLAQRVIDAVLAIAVNYVTFLLKSKPEVLQLQPK
jgi:hypothetical protein